MSDLPRIEFPTDLPVSQRREDIAEAIRTHQVVIVAGETGSGKTTQLPKIALCLGRERIAHTQPRRIAARTIAERVAEELGTELGDLVGYQVRFTDQVSANTRIRLMTDGILLNAIHRDRELRAYDTIIIDEAHERSLNIDFLLGYLKTLLPKRPDLKVIITSATIDPESFAQHFADPRSGEPAPIIEVSGRTFPVEVRYRPLVERTPEPGSETDAISVQPRSKAAPPTIERDLFDAVGDAVAELSREAPGDILVFLSGEAEIRDAQDALSGRFQGDPRSRLQILPLYGRLSAAEQHRVFERSRAAGGGSGTRRIVLATNVAETSLTVPGIRYVIDAGTARISRYSARSKVQRLPIEAISQASARQRSGRSGRTSAGIAIRLYSEEDFASRPEFTEPEILRTGLASVILQMLSLGIGDIARFPFLTPPDQRGVRDGLDLLRELGAVEAKSGRGSHRITSVGRALARLPIEPRFARMIIEARSRGVTREVIAIVTGLTVQDVRERPADRRGTADQLHARFADPLGDIMTLLNLWNYLRELQQELSSSAFRRRCKAEMLNYLRVREWMDLVRQLQRAARASKPGETVPGSTSPPGDAGPLSEAIHRSMLAGLLSHLGIRDDRTSSAPGRGANRAGRAIREYQGSRGTRFALHPGSVLAKRPPEVVMSVELVETSRLFARNNAAIDPEWAEQLAGPLAKRQLSEPHWEKSQGAAVAYERVTLYGVPIVTRRRVQLARYDAEQARELFIQHALVNGEWDSPQAFDRANRQLRRELGELEERLRRRDIISDDSAVFDFYDARIPAEVTSTRSFEGWWKREQRQQPKLLTMRREDLLDPGQESAQVSDSAAGDADQEFPRRWQVGDQTLKLRYRFDPGADDDGVTVAVPVPLLPRLDAADFEKLVPGLREELVSALIKTLPKQIRKHVVPAADWARTLLTAIGPSLDHDHTVSGDAAESPKRLTELLAAEIRRRTSVPVSADDFDSSRLPAHLTPTFIIVDARGRTLGRGKDLSTLQQRYKDRAGRGVARVAAAAMPRHALEQRGITSWTFGDLPRHVDAKFARGSGVVRAYPAIVDRRTSVDLVIATDSDEQSRLSRRGLRRLLALSIPSPVSYIRDHLSNSEKLLLSAGPYRSLEDAIADVGLMVSEKIIRARYPEGLVWRSDDFQALVDAYSTAQIDEIYAGIDLTARILDRARRARSAIERAKSLQVLSQVTDAQAQLNGLVTAQGSSGEGFVSRTGAERMSRLPIYLEGIERRMSALTENPGRDRANQNDIDRAMQLFSSAGGAIPLPPGASERLTRARWMLEELRISLFAQQLKTAEPVSLVRIQKVLDS